MLSTARRQLPFATSVAINQTAKDIQLDLRRKLPFFLDRPTPFTMGAFGFTRSNKRNLRSEVFVKRTQAGYLKYAIEGGIRYAKRRAIPIPVGQRLNRYGNVPRRRIAKLLAQPNVFSGTLNGVAGIWQRGKGRNRVKHPKLLFAYEPKVLYRKTFPMRVLAQKEFQRVWSRNASEAMQRAMASAR